MNFEDYFNSCDILCDKKDEIILHLVNAGNDLQQRFNALIEAHKLQEEELEEKEQQIDKAIELLEIYALYNSDGYSGFYKIKEGIQSKHINYNDFKKQIEDILRGEDNEKN